MNLLSVLVLHYKNSTNNLIIYFQLKKNKNKLEDPDG